MASETNVEEAASRGGLGDFFREMNPVEWRTFRACASGWGLDGMDFMIYPLVIGTIMHQWSVAPGPAGLAATLTLLASAVGGWIAGYVSDRIGRVKVLQITILWFSAFSLLSALAQNFDQLVITRTLLGFGFGGEWAAGAILMGEVIRPAYRGRAVGSVQSAWAVGWGLAVLSQAIVFSLAPAAIAWRVMFAIGALPALLVLYLRRNVAEPEIAIAARRNASPGPLAIFGRETLFVTILGALLSTGAQGGYYAITFWMPTFLKVDRHLSIVGTTPYLAVLILGSFAGYLTGAWLSDRLGRRMLFLIFSAGAIVTIVAYTQIDIPNDAMLILGFPVGFFASGYFSGMGPFLTELFPTRLRGSGQGFCYNFGRGLGALFPALIGFLTKSVGYGNAIAIFAVAAYSLFFLAALALPETRGRVLTA
ncbi:MULTISPECIES: MFS transporter [unclassified Acidiphilium]|jgi:MFS family permease|uniref:MFS transporter n=1 Tax=unclassified Acidiphilium TaxID=2617493 RepID=UPI000BD1AFAA|nr:MULTISPECIES: MFS transporter [unclassified Acidiphilium]OYV55160.1 MAG: MFS transporter [Acidiphilium sp. 20-67-58]OYV87123.1 MAG: MFS transporter [Acidiphilium sp. 21-68-69]HQT61586.1 MFS transporter [Acidiphilium sp.]